jgi:hypothetical protein
MHLKKKLVKEMEVLARALFPKTQFTRKVVAKFVARRWTNHIIPEEEVLIAEKDWSEKERIVKKYKQKWPQQKVRSDKSDLARRINQLIEYFIENTHGYKNRIDKDRLRKDMWFHRYAYGFLPYEYVGYGLEHKDVQQKREYMSVRDKSILLYRANGAIDAYIIGHKYLTYKKLKPYFKRDAILIYKKSHFKKFKDFIYKHPVFVKKPISLSGGEGIELTDINTVKKTERELFNDFISKNERVLLEERVVQSDIMNSVNASSVNTTRVFTIKTKNEIIIPFSWSRVGRGKSFVDNASQGGIAVGVDVKSGKWVTNGFTEFAERFERHPDTNFVFKGFSLPDWEQLLQVCKDMATQIPHLKFVCWDMAHSKNGWVLIEGNDQGAVGHMQIVFGRGMKAEIEEHFRNVEMLF